MKINGNCLKSRSDRWSIRIGHYYNAVCPSSLLWRHNGHDGVSNHQPHDCLLNRLFRCRSKKTWKLCVTGLCAGNSPGTGEFPTQMASNAENVSIWWRHHDDNTCTHWLHNSMTDYNTYTNVNLQICDMFPLMYTGILVIQIFRGNVSTP